MWWVLLREAKGENHFPQTFPSSIIVGLANLENCMVGISFHKTQLNLGRVWAGKLGQSAVQGELEKGPFF